MTTIDAGDVHPTLASSASLRSTVIVLGAGIAGLAAADRLSKIGHKVKVIEQSDRCGGAHRSRQIGPYTFDVGSIFYEDAALIFDLAPDLIKHCPIVKRIQRRISPDGQILHYPIEPRDLLKWPAKKLLAAVWGLLKSRMTTSPNGSLEVATLNRLGPVFFRETGLAAYIERFHHVCPSKLDAEFFFKRMAFIERATRLPELAKAGWRAIRRKPFRATARPQLRVRPPEGYDVLFHKIRKHQEERGVQFCLSESLQKIIRDRDGFSVTTSGGAHHAKVVINTLPLDTLHRAVFDRPSGLTSIDMLTLFVSSSQLDPDIGNVLFNFHTNGRWKRSTIHSRIYPDMPANGRAFFSVEVTLGRDKSPDPEAAFTDFSAHMSQLGLASELVLEGHEFVKNCYPLYEPGYTKLLETRLADLSAQGLIMAGRQGRFEYLPTSTGVIRRVAEELDARGFTA